VAYRGAGKIRINGAACDIDPMEGGPVYCFEAEAGKSPVSKIFVPNP
jgi:hypothetical protein